MKNCNSKKSRRSYHILYVYKQYSDRQVSNALSAESVFDVNVR